jgi:hypothetical protein
MRAFQKPQAGHADERGRAAVVAEPGTLAIFRPAFGAAHLPSRVSFVQLIEQRLGVFEVWEFETLGEPVVDLAEHLAGFFDLTLTLEQAGEADRRAEFEKPGTLAAGDVDRGPEAALSLCLVRGVTQQNQLSLDAVESRRESSLSPLRFAPLLSGPRPRPQALPPAAHSSRRFLPALRASALNPPPNLGMRNISVILLGLAPVRPKPSRDKKRHRLPGKTSQLRWQ